MTDQLLHVPKRWLLWVYAIAPVVFSIYVVDSIFLDEVLKPHLGVTALFLPLYLLFFDLPHIMASFFGFLDKEYLKHYWIHIVCVLPLLSGASLALWMWNPDGVLLLYLFLTMYHVIKQLSGIGLLLGAPRTRVQTAWVWTLLLFSSLLLLLTVQPDLVNPAWHTSLSYTVFGLGIALLGFGGWYWYQTTSALAARFIISNTLLFAGAYFLILEHYFFLGYFAVRFVHDVSAFMFYSVHEHNRNAKKTHNWLYAIKDSVPVPIVVLVPVLGITLAFLVERAASMSEVILFITMLLGFFHYYLEGVMWKRQSLHRQYIRLQ